MKDTTLEIQSIHLKIWLSKTPGERLEQFLKDNEMMYELFTNGKTLKREVVYSKKNKI